MHNWRDTLFTCFRSSSPLRVCLNVSLSYIHLVGFVHANPFESNSEIQTASTHTTYVVCDGALYRIRQMTNARLSFIFIFYTTSICGGSIDTKMTLAHTLNNCATHSIHYCARLFASRHRQRWQTQSPPALAPLAGSQRLKGKMKKKG